MNHTSNKNNNSPTIRIVTRNSPLALWQATLVKNLILSYSAHAQIAIIGLTTEGDRASTRTPLNRKGSFVTALQEAVLQHTADIAVHSVKDMSANACPGLHLAAVCQREDPRDVWISHRYPSLNDLPKQATVGTSSPRRAALIHSVRSDLSIQPINGNINTRLSKYDRGEYDGIILAAAGLKRLRLSDRITAYLDIQTFIPAIGQAAIGVECREEDSYCRSLLKNINHDETATCVAAERTVNQVLGGDCHTPIAAHAHIQNNTLVLRAMVSNLHSHVLIHSNATGPVGHPISLGQRVAQDLLDHGAAALL